MKQPPSAMTGQAQESPVSYSSWIIGSILYLDRQRRGCRSLRSKHTVCLELIPQQSSRNIGHLDLVTHVQMLLLVKLHHIIVNRKIKTALFAPSAVLSKKLNPQILFVPAQLCLDPQITAVVNRAYFLQLIFNNFNGQFNVPDRLHITLFVLFLKQEENIHDQFFLLEPVLGTFYFHTLILQSILVQEK